MSDDNESQTPLEQYTQASREGPVNPVAWGLFILGHYLFGIAFLSAMSVAMLGWVHDDGPVYAWYAGALLAAAGIPLGFVRFGFGRRLKASEQVADEKTGTPVGSFASMFVGAFLGALLGGLLAFFVLMIWASIALCPLAPVTWRQDLLKTISYSTVCIVGGVGLLGFVSGPFLNIKSYRPSKTADPTESISSASGDDDHGVGPAGGP
jgi:hypothetical protein